MINENKLALEEKTSPLFQLDPVLPDRYLQTVRSKAISQPEKRLMLAILDDAVACYGKYAGARDGRGKRLFNEALEWIVTEDRDWPFSFENVCETLGLDPNYVREGVLGRKRRVLTGASQTEHHLAGGRRRGRCRDAA